MGTRSLIRLKNNETGSMIYKHWDGYPSATVPWLLQAIKDFTENRSNDDYEYFNAFLLKSIYKYTEKFGLDDSVYTGWGILKDGSQSVKKAVDQFGVDYCYTIDLNDGSVTIGNSKKHVYNIECPVDEKLLKRLEKL